MTKSQSRQLVFISAMLLSGVAGAAWLIFWRSNGVSVILAWLLLTPILLLAAISLIGLLVGIGNGRLADRVVNRIEAASTAATNRMEHRHRAREHQRASHPALAMYDRVTGILCLGLALGCGLIPWCGLPLVEQLGVIALVGIGQVLLLVMNHFISPDPIDPSPRASAKDFLRSLVGLIVVIAVAFSFGFALHSLVG